MCWIGGSARRLCHETGCRVTGVDLSDEYIDVAERLTKLLNMHDRVKFDAASALEMPYDDHTFDGAWSIQMSMNIEDKQELFQELFRVLKPGGRAILYEVVGNTNSPVYFPVPWAQNNTMSFLMPPDLFRDVIASVGFKIDVWNDKTDLAQQAFSHMTEPKDEPELPELGVHLLVGNDIMTKAYNLHRNLNEERVSLIETLLIKPMD